MTKRAGERSVDAVAAGDSGLHQLLQAARFFDRLDEQIQPCLPEQMRGMIRIACVEGDCLVIAADSPAWASRARLLADELLNEANRHLDKPLARTRVTVVPSAGNLDEGSQ